MADAIGARLARLAQRVQVIAVTHAPQVAARAERHFLIAKDVVAAEDRAEPPAGTERIATRVVPIEAMACAARRSPACWPARPSPTRRGPRRSGCWNRG